MNKNVVPAFDIDFGGNNFSDAMNYSTAATIENGSIVYY